MVDGIFPSTFIFMERRIVKVIVDINASDVDKIYDYYTDYEEVVLGSRVVVSFGARFIEGYVIGFSSSTDYPIEKLKPITRIVEEVPPLTRESLEITEYMRNKYHTSRASILKLFLPSELRKGKVRKKKAKFVHINDEFSLDEMLSSTTKTAEKQRGVIEFLWDNRKIRQSIINGLFSPSAVKAVIGKGFAFVTEEVENRIPYRNLENVNKTVNLTDEQQNAINVILNSEKPVLVHGVTGSGKTEVYLQVIRKIIAEGKTAIFLVPEISLTPQMFARFRGTFGDLCAILHSGLSAGEKFDEWCRLRCGEARIAIGARSAIFAPIENVGIIVIDEEHDGSYNSETNPRYTSKDIALFRRRYNNAKLVFGSATPSIGTYLEAMEGRYDLVEMKRRVNGKELPEVSIVDLREEVKSGNPSPFSRELKAEIQKTLDEGNQAIIFLNRRGYSQKVICRECGYVAKCTDCDVSLKYHKYENVLKCHYCGKTFTMLSGCPSCGGTNINYSVMGTEKVVEELENLFPSAKILRMDNDAMKSKDDHLKILKDFGERKANILVGTQMVSKGHDFPFVTLVGILDGDMSLFFNDYRAGEITYQLITQVAGRGGRADKKGKVVLQTYSPHNQILKFAVSYNYKGFYEHECSVRKSTHFPPFSDIVRIMVESNDDEKALEQLKIIFFKCREVYDNNQKDFVFFNRMRSPVKKVMNQYRYQVLMRIVSNRDEIEEKLYKIVDESSAKDVYCYMEVNPSSLS